MFVRSSVRSFFRLCANGSQVNWLVGLFEEGGVDAINFSTTYEQIRAVDSISAPTRQLEFAAQTGATAVGLLVSTGIDDDDDDEARFLLCIFDCRCNQRN